MAGLFQVRPGVPADWLRLAMAALVRRHAALHTRFAVLPAGWQQVVEPARDVPFLVLDLAAESRDAQETLLAARLEELQRSLDPQAGRIATAAFFDLGPQRPARFCLVLHHLAVDLTSWPVLIQDLETASRQIAAGEEVRLAPATTPVTEWARRLRDRCRSAEMEREVRHWLTPPRYRPVALPVDHPGGTNDVAALRSVVLTLDVERTRRLREQAAKAHGMQIGEVLLAGLVRGLASWTGSRSLVLDLEGHGREDLFADADLSRTVGWLTCLYPLVFETAGLDEPEGLLTSVKSQLRAVPHGGVGYGVLRYLSPDEEVRRRLAAMPEAEVVFNYLGRSAPPSSATAETAILTPVEESAGTAWSPRLVRAHLLEVEGSLVLDEVRMRFRYSENLHRRSTVEELAQRVAEALDDLLGLPAPATAKGLSATDFPAANLSAAEFATLWREIQS
jgi:non-ribosomal peptide synthase protein (TIGR01720 family)